MPVTQWDSGAVWNSIWVWDGGGQRADALQATDTGFLSAAQMMTSDVVAASDAIVPVEAVVPLTDSLTPTETTKYPAYGLDALTVVDTLGLEAALPLADALTAADQLALSVLIDLADAVAATDGITGLVAALPVTDALQSAEFAQRQALQVLHFALAQRHALESPLAQGSDERRRYAADLADIGMYADLLSVTVYAGSGQNVPGVDVTAQVMGSSAAAPILIEPHLLLLPFLEDLQPDLEYRVEVQFRLDGEVFERYFVVLGER